jgi:hypothetical protein
MNYDALAINALEIGLAGNTALAQKEDIIGLHKSRDSSLAR